MAPGQGGVDEQIHSCVQRCGERSSGLVGQTRGTAGVDIRRTCNDGCLTCKNDKACVLTERQEIDNLPFDFRLSRSRLVGAFICK